MHPSSCTVRKELIIKLKHMSCVTWNCYMIADICKLNKDDFKSKIMMNRLFHLLYIEIHSNDHGAYIFSEIQIYIFSDVYP